MTRVDPRAEALFRAQRTRTAIAPIDAGADEAYDLQDRVLALRLDDGERVIGAKLGLTSRAKQQQMGVEQPIYGPLTDVMPWPADTPLPVDGLIHPRVEPEIAFVLGRPLAGPGITAAHVLAATSGVTAALEVIDSRYQGFRFTYADVVADLTSAAHVVVGPVLVAPSFDLSLVGCVFAVDGRIVETAAGAAVLGSPAEAVAQLANHLGRRGGGLEAGALVLSGALTNAVALEAGSEVRATFGRLGTVAIRGA